MRLGTTANASPALPPHQSLEVIGGGELGSSKDDPIVSVKVAVDHVVFSDGSEAGENALNKGPLAVYRQAVKDYRRQLLSLYRERGLDALLQELGIN